MKRLVIAMIIAASSLLPTATTYANRSDRIAIAGNFIIIAWQDTDVMQHGQNTIVKSAYTEVVTGDVTGTVTGEQTAILHPNGSQTVSGTDNCVCTVNGIGFTAVIRFRANGDTNFLNGAFEIIKSDQNGVTGNGIFSVNLVTGVIGYEGVIDLGQ